MIRRNGNPPAISYGMKQHRSLAIVAASALMAIGAMAQQSENRIKQPADRTFVTKAAQGGLAEVELGNLAAQKASSDEVKRFGQHMVDDHTKANDELKSIAAAKGETVPGSIDAKDMALKNHLSSLTGAAFDKAYMEDMVKDHKADVAEFQKEADHGTDPEVKAFAQKTLPTLQQHLQMAQDTLNNLK